VKVEVKEVEELVRELLIEVPADTVSSSMNQKLMEVRRDAHLKGFRKGKAPMDMIRTLYEDQVKADVAEDLVKSTYLEAIRENTLRVASHPTVTDFNYLDDGAIQYTAKVEVFPEIGDVVYDGLDLKSMPIEIADEEVDQVVETLRVRQAEVREVDRAAADGDLVAVDLEKLADPGMVLKEDKFPESEVDLGSKMTVAEFREQLLGAKAGDVKEIEVKYADDYPDATFAGAQLKYKCTVKAVKERLLPEINDGFAKSTQQAETMLELRMLIRERLTTEKTEDQKRAHKQQLTMQVCQKNEIAIPKALIGDYLDNVVQDFKNRGGEFDEAEVRTTYAEIGAANIRWNMLLHRLAEQEKIEVLPSDTENLIEKFAKGYNMTNEQAKEALQKSNRIADLRESILEDKVIDFLTGKAKIVSNKS